MQYGSEINRLRSLDYRIKLMMQQGKYEQAQRFVDELLPLYDWFVQVGHDPKRVVGHDRKHYEVLKHQAGERGRQADAASQDWIGEVEGHISSAESSVKTDLRSAAAAFFRIKDMVDQKQVPPDTKKPLYQKLEGLGGAIKHEAWDLGESARNSITLDAPGACTKYEIAIEVLRKMGMEVKAKELEEELGTAVYAQQTGSKLQQVKERLAKASKADEVDRIQAEMEAMKHEIQTNAARAAQSQSSGQAAQMQAIMGQILKEVEETKQAASQQRQVIVAQNVYTGDQITIKDSVVQRSQIGGGGSDAPIIAQQATSSTNVKIEDSVVMRTQVGGAQEKKPEGGPPVPSKPDLPTEQAPHERAQKKFSICPYCGKELNLPTTPNFCPFCTQRLK